MISFKLIHNNCRNNRIPSIIVFSLNDQFIISITNNKLIITSANNQNELSDITDNKEYVVGYFTEKQILSFT